VTTPLRRVRRRFDTARPRKHGVLSQHSPAGGSLRFETNPETVLVPPPVGGWSEVPHPRGLTTVEWQGRPPRRAAFPLLLAARTRRALIDPGGSVERDVALLTSWGQPTGSLAEPPVLRLDFGPAETGLYVLQALVPTVERRRPSDLARFLVEFDVELVEWREATILLTPAKQAAAARPAAAPAKPSGRTYTVRRGDTLSAIAARLLGKASRWPEIAKLNGVRDPRRLQIGQVLRIP
jgi:hypothetical protein